MGLRVSEMSCSTNSNTKTERVIKRVRVTIITIVTIIKILIPLLILSVWMLLSAIGVTCKRELALTSTPQKLGWQARCYAGKQVMAKFVLTTSVFNICIMITVTQQVHALTPRDFLAS